VRAEQTVPCNNDLLAENFIDVGGELRLIDYEYSGNKRGRRSSSATSGASRTSRLRSSRSSSRTTTAAAAAHKVRVRARGA